MVANANLAVKAEAFVVWAAGLLATDGPTARTRQDIADAVRRLGTEVVPADETSLADLHGAGAVATILARTSDGPVLMLARFPPDAPTPVHNHNSWGIVCVVAGRDRYLRWERLDDGSDPDHARIALASDLELGPGDVAFLDDPPGDLHSQQGIGGPVWELVFFGHDPDAVPRAYFEPESGNVTYASSAR
ncbi:MAG TPA: hypothetical protein VIM30_17300 [Candidatus Limnocylindrales bacterium]